MLPAAMCNGLFMVGKTLRSVPPSEEVSMYRRFALGFLLLSFTLPLVAQKGTPFDPSCDLPLDADAVKHDFDEVCGVDGTGANAPKILQNEAKNNFCATGDAVLVTFASFAKLEALVEDPVKRSWASLHCPEDPGQAGEHRLQNDRGRDRQRRNRG